MGKRIVIEWDGKSYPVSDDQAFDLMDQIEAQVTLPELLAMIGSGVPNFSKLARALHVMLGFVGVKNLPDLLELRRMLVGEGLAALNAKARGDEVTAAGAAMSAVAGLVHILMDGAPQSDETSVKKTTPHLSKAATRSRSANGASRRATSGK
jgi:hypothetical protein